MLRRLIRSILKMMYTLTQEELDNLVPKSELERLEKAMDWMRNTFVQRCPYNSCPPPGRLYTYCSMCPVSDIGPEDELHQIPKPTREISKAICHLQRNYSK